MDIISVDQNDHPINQLVNQAVDNKQPILLRGKQGNAVLISEKDWNALQETLYLQSIPHLVDSIQKGGETRLEDCVDESTVRDILNG